MLALFALPTIANANAPSMQLQGWQTNIPRAQCLERMEAAFATANFTNIRHSNGRVWANAGEYMTGGLCLNSFASVSVAGPEASVTGSLYSRVARAWEN